MFKKTNTNIGHISKTEVKVLNEKNFLNKT